MRRVHNRCGTPVSYSNVSTGYSAQCPECDEDVYLIETVMDDIHGWCDSCQNEADVVYSHRDIYYCIQCRD